MHDMEQLIWNTVSFPSFKDGNVTILLDVAPPMKIRLHQAVLSKSSPWFEAQFAAIDERRQNGNTSKTDYEFIFEPNVGPGTLSLVLVACVSIRILDILCIY